MSGRSCNCGSRDMKSIKAISEQLEIKSRSTTVGGGFFGGKGGVGAARSYGNLSPGIIKKIQWRIPHKTGIFNISITGGVAANKRFREKANLLYTHEGVRLYFPETTYCTDNAAMIAIAGYQYLKRGKESLLSLEASPNLALDEINFI